MIFRTHAIGIGLVLLLSYLVGFHSVGANPDLEGRFRIMVITLTGPFASAIVTPGIDGFCVKFLIVFATLVLVHFRWTNYGTSVVLLIGYVAWFFVGAMYCHIAV